MPFILYKPVSATPFEMVRMYRRDNPKSSSEKIGYAGRLDPMAEGLLLLLIGDENKERKKYERLEKEYEFEVLFGIGTDSYDPMGIITDKKLRNKKEEIRKRLSEILRRFVGKMQQEYPPYSSAVVGGKPLYWWTRQGRLDEITIPSKEVKIKELEVVGWRDTDAYEVAQTAISRIQNVTGDFRQKEIIDQWRLIAARQTYVTYPLARCRVVCSSGTYVRGLVHSLGRALHTPALAYSIKRTRIGTFAAV